MNYDVLTTHWNADPNAPEVELRVDGNDVILEFYLNYFRFDSFRENDKATVAFRNCHKYSFDGVNDHAYFGSQHRYNVRILPWGELHKLETDWTVNFNPNSILLQPSNQLKDPKHYIFFFRDNSFECVADAYQLLLQTENNIDPNYIIGLNDSMHALVNSQQDPNTEGSIDTMLEILYLKGLAKDQAVAFIGGKKQISVNKAEKLVEDSVVKPFKAIHWEGDLDDDCSAYWGNLLLRAECMEGDIWWWAINIKQGNNQYTEIDSSNNYDSTCVGGEMARQLAAETARRFSMQNPKQAFPDEQLRKWWKFW